MQTQKMTASIVYYTARNQTDKGITNKQKRSKKNVNYKFQRAVEYK